MDPIGGPRTLRLILPVLVAAFLTAGVRPAAAVDPCAGGQATELCGTTTVTSDGSGAVTVHLSRALEIVPHDVRMQLFDLQTDARVAGFALTSAQDGDSNAVLLGGRILPGAPADTTFLFGADKVLGAATYRGDELKTVGTVDLGAGDYRLSIFSTGPRVVLTLHLPQLPGSSSFDAAAPNDAVVKTPDASPGLPAADASVTASLARRGVLIGAVLVHTDAFVSGQVVMCRKAAPAPGTDGCDLGDPANQTDDPGVTFNNDRDPAPAPTTRLMVHSTGLVAAQDYAYELANVTEGSGVQRTFAAIWLPIFGN